MFYKSFGYVPVIIFSILLSYPAFSQENRSRTVTIENNLQNFQSSSPSPISSYIDEIDKKNQSLKQDLLLLRNQVNNLSKEINNTKSSENDNFVKTALEKQWSLILSLFFFLILVICFIFYKTYSKLKENNEKSINIKIEELSEQTKREILKEYKIKEAEHHVDVGSIAEIRQEEFEKSLNNTYIQYLKDLAENNNDELNKFKENSEIIIRENTNNFELNLKDIFEQKNKEFKEKIDEKFPTDTTESIINKVIEDKGIVDSITDNIQDKVLMSLNNKIKELDANLDNKENEILKDIQKAQLANNNFNIGNIYLKEGKYEEAIEEFHLALRTDPSFYGAYINLGKAYEMINNTENAIDMYNQAITSRPEHYKAYFNLGNLLNSVKKYDDAAFMYKKALEFSPDNYKIYNNMGISYQLMKKMSLARDYYLKSIVININYPDAYVNLAKLETEMGNDRGVYQIAESYLKKNNASQETYYKVKDLAYSTIS